MHPMRKEFILVRIHYTVKGNNIDQCSSVILCVICLFNDSWD